MLDPLVVGFALSAVAALVAFVFYLFSGGDNFDKVYDEKKKQILAGTEKEKQSKKKTIKKKDVKDKKGDAGDKTDGVEPETAEEVVKTETAEVVSSSDETKETGEGKNKKKNKKAKKTSESADEAVVIQEPKPETPKPSPTPAANQEGSPKKSKKKEKKEKKVEEQGDNNEWIPATKKEKMKVAAPKEPEAKVVEAPVQQKAAPVVASTPAPALVQIKERIVEIRTGFAPEIAKFLNEGPLDLPKLMKAFNSDPILTKCATVMRTYIEQSDKQHAETVEALSRNFESRKAELARQNEIDKKAAGHHEETQQIILLLTAEKKNIQKQLETVQAELATVRSSSEANMKRAENAEIQLKDTVRTMSTAEKAAHDAKEDIRHKNEEIAHLKQNVIAAQEAKLREANLIYERVAEEANKRENQLKEELLNLQNQFEQLQGKYNAPAGGDMDYEKLMEEYLKIKALVDQLNEEVPKFEVMKQELNEKNAQFLTQEKKLASLEQSQKTLEKENADLRNQIAELSKKLSAAAAAPQTTNDDAGEEIVILSHASNQLAALPSSNGALEEENKRLQEKNDELRARNFKLMDRVKEAEGNHSDAPAKSDNAVSSSVISERTKAISILKTLPEISSIEVPKPNDDTAYSAWLSSVEKSLKATQKGSKKNKANKESDSSEEAQVYRQALVLLEDELNRIQELVDEKEEKHENEVRTLKEQLKKASLVPATTKKAPISDHSADELGWEVI